LTIYVSNLGYDVTEQDLKKLIRPLSEISSINVITDYNTGSSRGFVFIEMPNDTEAQKTISQLNGTELKGRAMLVQVARPKEEHKGSSQYSSQLVE